VYPRVKTAEFVRKEILRRWKAYEDRGGKQVDFAARAEVRQGVISTWLQKMRGGEIPKLEGIDAFARGFEIPVASLFPSEAQGVHRPQGAHDASSPSGQNSAEPDGESKELTELRTILAALDETQKQSLMTFARALAKPARARTGLPKAQSNPRKKAR
jgi:hypothetical protein